MPVAKKSNSDSQKTEKKTMSAASLANLKPFKSGEEWTGNAGGRPKKGPLTEATEEMLAEKLSNPVERERWKNAQWEKMLKSGVVGAMFMDTAWERTEGKVTQPVDVNVNLTLRERMRKAEEKIKNHNG